MTRIVIILIFLSLGATVNAQYKFLCPFDAQGVPSCLNMEGVTQRMKNNISASLPEGKPVPVYNPQYIAGVDTDLKLQGEADVWVTFVAEGAGYKNVLGYYTYDLNNPPSSAPPSSAITIIFPNVSAQGSGGGLVAGHQAYLGKFPANTGVGWVLIADGFKNGTVTNGNWILYSTPAFNPEGNPSLKYHNVLLKDDNEQKIVMGFEDIRRDYGNCDNDFNDALFFITISPNSAAYTGNINTVTESNGGVGTGGNGGLESEGSLADKVATRHFQHQTTPQPDYEHPAASALLATHNQQARLAAGALAQFMPETPFDNSKAYVSTPTDLLKITNAKAVFAADYFVDNARIAATLATYTEGEVYNHTKTICDRLNGGSVEEITSRAIRGGNFTLTKIRQLDGTIEYAICFSVSDETDQYRAESNWTIAQFAKGKNYLNFQVWAANPTNAQVVVEQILDKLAAQKSLTFATEKPAIPSVFVQSGYYAGGKLMLTIRNNAKASKIYLNGVLKRTETENMEEKWTTEYALNQQDVQSIEVSLDQFFDSGITVENNQTAEKDVLYLADSPWGIDAAATSLQSVNFQVSKNQKLIALNGYVLERNAAFKGNVKNNISVFKLLKPSAQAVDMSAYEGVQFEAAGKGIWEVVLLKKSIQNIDEQFRFDVWLGGNTKTYTIPYADFRSTKLKQFDASDVTAVVFSYQGNNAEYKAAELSVSDLQFTKQLAPTAEQLPELAITLYPNPTVSEANATFTLTEPTDVTVSLLDATGRTLWSKTSQGQEGPNEVALPVGSMETGMYWCSVQSKTQKATKKLLVAR